jgi:hypothetical protein
MKEAVRTSASKSAFGWSRLIWPAVTPALLLALAVVAGVRLAVQTGGPSPALVAPAAPSSQPYPDTPDTQAAFGNGYFIGCRATTQLLRQPQDAPEMPYAESRDQLEAKGEE